MPSKNITTHILPGNYYHIFNRGNNYEKVFYNQEDYYYFLKKYKYYLSECCDTYAYALLPNHYHFLIQIKESSEDGFFSKQFKLLIQNYTFRINSRENRSGNLFLKLFRRLEVNSDEYFKRLVFYIHYNSEKHGINIDFKNYNYSSYKAIVSVMPTYIQRQDVIDWFGDKNDFIDFHNYLHSEDAIDKLILE